MKKTEKLTVKFREPPARNFYATISKKKQRDPNSSNHSNKVGSHFLYQEISSGESLYWLGVHPNCFLNEAEK